MFLLEPNLSFTIPSIHDDITLDCRVYNPPASAFSDLSGSKPWKARGAVITHPYAPLGGSYDDPVVLGVVGELLQQHFVVGTFNFRYVLDPILDCTWSNSLLFEGVPEVPKARLVGRLNRSLQTMSASLASCCITFTTSNELSPQRLHARAVAAKEPRRHHRMTSNPIALPHHTLPSPLYLVATLTAQ